ncbi:uncharacterized protein LOC129580962 [Paramacrobiotus metropolitanus]|uniref:uncharacterized protein LOC129580962 n=1 Tax=Paramacrobiotus metropolitanus TaxID=2943436 RepID=UPI002445B837|nr:uncharacterized protein LOC129580962 [Paramacrobiotus metropolitanus]
MFRQIWSFLLFFVCATLVTKYGVEGLSCMMCNSLMKSKWEACPGSNQHHAMLCRSATRYCIKIDGNHTVVNQSAPTQSEKIKQTIGIQLNCASKYNMKLFGFDQDKVQVKSQSKHCVDNVDLGEIDLTAAPNPDGTFSKLFFKGKVCFCNYDNCNSPHVEKYS